MKKQRLAAYSAFESTRLVAEGDLSHVVAQAKTVWDRSSQLPISIFDNATGRPVDVDFSGDCEEVLDRLPPEPLQDAVAPVGRPKPGVKAREVTLLPRHWEWLDTQPGGASVALRKLVEAARRVNADKDRLRRVQEAVDRFMTEMAGDFPNFEAASRALYRGERAHFESLIEDRPADVRDHLQLLSAQSGWSAAPDEVANTAV